MNLEQQVVSLDLAKRLKELGVKQISLYHWFFYDTNPFTDDRWIITTVDEDEQLVFDINTYIAAFTVAELGELLPKAIQIKTEEEEKKIFSYFRFVTGRSLIFEEDKPYEVWSVNYICDTTNQFRNWLFDTLLTKAIYDKNEANCRAKMLIYLIEKELIKVNE